MQLYLIYHHLEQIERIKNTESSTKTSSKSSINNLESFYSHDSSILNLDFMGKKIAQEERKLMYISDLRRIKENIRMITVPSIKEIPHSSSQPIFSQNEVLICFLLTPRLAQIIYNNKKINVLINVLPDESKFSLTNEKYLLECKELMNMTSIFVCEIDEIQEIFIKSPDIILWIYNQPLRVIYKSEEECKKYHIGLKHLLQKK